MQTIKKKLRSQYGASITFALLLFLVCAVLCSVIIVAATTASGRMSNLAEMDQRYYAVTSAAELMKELLKEPITIVQRDEIGRIEETTHIKTETAVMTIVPTEVVTESGTTTENRAVTEITTEFENVGPKLADNQPETKIKRYLLKKMADAIVAAVDYVPQNQFEGEGALKINLNTASLVNDAAWMVFQNHDSFTRNYTLSSLTGDIPQVDMKETLRPKDRLLILEISNSSGPKYTLELTFQANKTGPTTSPGTVTKKSSTSDPVIIPAPVDDSTTVTTTTTITTDTYTRTDTTTMTVYWELKDIRTKTTA